MTHHQIPVSGGSLPASIEGDGPPIICLHGWTMSADMWQPQQPLSEAGYTLITYDRRGFGAATAEGDMNREVDDVAAVLDYFGFDKATLLGMSQGSRIALRVAALTPERLDRLILQGAVMDGSPATLEGSEALPMGTYKKLMEQGDFEGFKSLWSQHPLIAYDRKKAPELLTRLLDNGRPDFPFGAPR